MLAAGANAFATVLQRIGVEEAEPLSRASHHLMAAVIKRPVWFAGLVLTTGSFLLQALALSFGNLSTVQPIMVTEILFLVVILGTWFHHQLHWTDWLAVLGTAVGLGVFLALSYSKEGHSSPTKFDWMLLLFAAVGAIALGVVAAQRGRRSWRAACLRAERRGLLRADSGVHQDRRHRVAPRCRLRVLAPGGVFGRRCGVHRSRHRPARPRRWPGRRIAGGAPHRQPAVQHRHGHLAVRGPRPRHGSRAIIEGVFLGVMFYSLLQLSQSPLISSSLAAEQLSNRRSLAKARPPESAV